MLGVHFVWLEGTGKHFAAIASRMQGHQATIRDIVLDLTEIADSCDLLCGEESLSPDAEEEQELFKIDSRCEKCKTGIRVCVQASSFGIRCLQRILTEEVSFLCPRCSRDFCQDGRF